MNVFNQKVWMDTCDGLALHWFLNSTFMLSLAQNIPI